MNQRGLEITELQEWFDSWHILPETSGLTWSKVYEVYSWAIHRMTEIATSNPGDANTLALEAIAIADFLIQEFATWFMKMDDDELEEKFAELRNLDI